MLQYIVFSVMLIAGLALIVLQEKLGAASALYPYLTQISSTLLVGGTISLLYKLFVDRDSEKRLKQMLRIHESIHESGLDEIVGDSKSHNFSAFIKHSQELSIVMNDGLRWIGNYSVEMEERFSRKGTETELFLVDGDGHFLPALAHKTEVSAENLKEKLHQTKLLLVDTLKKSRQQGRLLIYALKNYPTQSIFRGDNTVIVTPYQASSGRRTIPLFVYRDLHNEGCIAADISEDLDNLRKESKIIFDSDKAEWKIAPSA